MIFLSQLVSCLYDKVKIKTITKIVKGIAGRLRIEAVVLNAAILTTITPILAT